MGWSKRTKPLLDPIPLPGRGLSTGMEQRDKATPGPDPMSTTAAWRAAGGGWKRGWMGHSSPKHSWRFRRPGDTHCHTVTTATRCHHCHSRTQRALSSPGAPPNTHTKLLVGPGEQEQPKVPQLALSQLWVTAGRPDGQKSQKKKAADGQRQWVSAALLLSTLEPALLPASPSAPALAQEGGSSTRPCPGTRLGTPPTLPSQLGMELKTSE